MKKLYNSLCMAILFLVSLATSAQVLIPENFENTTTQNPVPPGWSFVSSPAVESTTANPCEGNRSVRMLINSNNTNPTLRSVDQVATGDDIKVSFQYKIIDQSGGGATPLGFGSFDLQYTTNANAPSPIWTTYAVIDDTNHNPSTSCATHTATIPAADVPAGSDFAWRIKVNWATGAYRLYIDDFLAVEEVPCIAPIYIKVDNITYDEATVSWTDLNNATEWTIEYGPVGFPPGLGFGTVITTNTNPTTLTNLDDGTEYDVYVKAECSPTSESNYTGPVTFQTIAIGTDCTVPLEITSLPYTHSDNTNRFGNSYSGSPGTGCIGNNYLQGFDVVYEYTPTLDDYLKFELSNLIGEDSVGLFVYESCNDIGTNCYAGGTTDTGSDFSFDVFVTANQTYYFVLATAGTGTTTEFTLDISGFDCANFGAPAGQTTYEFFGQQLSAFDGTNQGVQTTNDFAQLNWYYNDNGTPGALIPDTSTITLSDNDVYFVNQSLGTCQSAYLMVTFTEFDCLGQLEILTTDPGDVICGEGTTTMHATAATDNLFWYANEFGGDPIGAGNDFTTPNINQTTSFWVAEAFVGEGNLTGQARPGPSTVATSTINNYGLIVENINSDFTLVDVQVFSTAGGGVINIELRDETGGTGTQTASVSIPSGTPSSPTPFTVPLNFELKSGNKYRLLKTSGPQMIYSTGNTFPYSVGDVAEVTSGASNTLTNSSYYYFYNWTITEEQPLCESPRTEVVATVHEIIDISATAASYTVCVGQDASLSVTSTDTNYIYTWTWNDPSGAPQTATGAQIQVTIIENTTFSVSGYNPVTTCTSPTETVMVEAIGSDEILVTPETVETCVGEIVKLFAGGVFYDFEDTNTGWATVNNSTGPSNPAGAGWKLVSSPHNPTGGITSNDNSQFYISMADEIGPGGNLDTELISPPINLVGVQNATLTFYHLYDYIQTKPTAGKVEVSVANGPWSTIKTYTGDQGTPPVTPTEFVFESLDLSAYSGAADVRIRFKYTGDWGWWWAIDNVDIIKDYTNGQITWTSTNDLFLDEAATVPYTGLPTNQVYFMSETPGTFTYNVNLDIVGCSDPVTNQVVITVDETLPPTGPANQIYVKGQTLSSLDVTGQDLRYYILEDGEYVEMSPNFLLKHGTTYYITQTMNGCESEYLEVTVELDCPAPTDVTVSTEIGTNGTTAAVIVTWTPPASTTSIQNYYLKITDSSGNTVFQGTAKADANFRVIQGLALEEEFELEMYSICDPDIPVTSIIATVSFNTIGLGTKENAFNGFTFYPNPATDVVTFSNVLPINKVEVFSVIGQKVYETQNIDQREVQINFANMSSGVYFSIVTVGDASHVVRVVRE